MEYSILSIKTAKKLFGVNHVQIADLLNGQVFSLLELQQSEEAIKVAQESLLIADGQELVDPRLKCSCLFLLGKAFKIIKW